MSRLAGSRDRLVALVDRIGLHRFAGDARLASEMTRLLRDRRVPAACESLSDAAFERIRRSVVAAYLAGATAAPVAASAGAAARPPRRRMSAGIRAGGRGLLVLASLALLLGVLSGGALAESGPGHSLYPVRLALETLTLPARGSQERIDAQLGRLEQRVREAADAARASDGHAVDDAVTAYRETLRDVAELTKAQPSSRRQVAERLRQASTALTALADRAAPAFRDHVVAAVAETCATRRELWNERADPAATSPAPARLRDVGLPRLGVAHWMAPRSGRQPLGRPAIVPLLPVRAAGTGIPAAVSSSSGCPS